MALNMPSKGYQMSGSKAFNFCIHCGANIPPIVGEGTCKECDPEGCRLHADRLEKRQWILDNVGKRNI